MDKKKVVREGYDKIAEEYSDWRRTFKNRKQLEELADLLPEKAKVLDVGCGTGIPVTKFLFERGYEVVGIDFSSEMLKMARINVPQVQFLEKNMTQLDFEDGSFDGVTAFYSVFHVPREEQGALFQSFHNILKPGGLVLVSFGRTEWEGTEDFHGALMFWSQFWPQESLELVERAGFNIIFDKDIEDGDETHYWVLARKVSSKPRS